MEAEAAGATGYDGDFAIKGEDVLEVFEFGLGFCFVGHDGVLGWVE